MPPSMWIALSFDQHTEFLLFDTLFGSRTGQPSEAHGVNSWGYAFLRRGTGLGQVERKLRSCLEQQV